MKSPQDISARMQRQWQRKQFRLEMLTTVNAWPMQYNIGKPAASDITASPNAIREHLECWHRVSVGEVVWRDVSYRASSEPIRVPSHWVLERPSDWVRATAARQVISEYDMLEYLIGYADSELRNALIINLKLLQGRSPEELLTALELAASLKPGEAQGRPLRLLSGHGVDTKFFERNSQLLIRLLDSRFEGEVSEQGLHGFLDAAPDGEHWLFIVPMQKGVLPFQVQQVRSQELLILKPDMIRARRILVVENRQCWHLLPELDDTIAILGGGFDLDWLGAKWLKGKDVAYWGDIDTWGFVMLARARQYLPQLSSILMDRQTFERHATGNSVVEPVSAGEEPPAALDVDERDLYNWLLTLEHGRLEQEYLPVGFVHEALRGWGQRV
ncbi:MAG: Wadjet anti-phage system protein JetD domain-containing protein [Granulosicoccus sp.]